MSTWLALSANKLAISSARAWLPLSTSERTMKLQCPPPGPRSTMPRLLDVSTTPGTARLRRRTPWGAACSEASHTACSPAASTASVVPGATLSVMPASTPASSLRSKACQRSSAAASAGPCPAGRHTLARASRGRALRAVPPTRPARRSGSVASSARSTRTSSLMALPRSSWMSTPECPPRNPASPICHASKPPGTGSPAPLRETFTSSPPAQPR